MVKQGVDIKRSTLASLQRNPHIKDVVSHPIITNADPKKDGSADGRRKGLQEIQEEVEFYNQLVDASDFDNNIKIDIKDLQDSGLDYENIYEQVQTGIDQLEKGKRPDGVNFDIDGLLDMSDEEFLKQDRGV